ncbi:hypothetical protein AVEN_222042-1 [Araneus ventricosus]|uniref:Sushi domain-containing protein n=1 Tax=Araneus ventricosus TaxID=182803 RepID=A0A4Y2SRF9_ARAVE|nr:hypothetical protein AVEN_222042-1 [Araneus ventricosus]
MSLREGYSRGWSGGVNDHPGWASPMHVYSYQKLLVLKGLEEKSRLGIKELRYCTGSCFPGYFFEFLSNMVQIILICDGESWRPLHGFPPCKLAAGCSLRQTSHGKFNCSSDADGTHCDVRCGFDNYQGLHHCNEKGEWSPSLPYCFTPAVEHEKALCLDPGTPEGATRTTVNGTDASTVQMFEEGESLNFTCKGQHLILEGSHIITCRSDSRWSASRPQCIRSPSGASGSSTVHWKVSSPFQNGHLLY